jgi:hypothetical protein
LPWITGEEAKNSNGNGTFWNKDKSAESTKEKVEV